MEFALFSQKFRESNGFTKEITKYSSLSNTRTVWNKHTGRPNFVPPVFLFDILLNKNPKTVSNKAVQVEIFWQNK